MSTPTPPKIFKLLLRWFVSEELREEITGDFDETYLETYRQKGKLRANLEYIIGALRIAPMYNKGRNFQSTNRLSMFINHLKIARRSMIKNRVHTLINLVGLSTGLACVIILLLHVKIETNYDRFHDNGKNIYRLQHIYGFINALAGPTYARDYEDVEAFLRISKWAQNQKITIDEDVLYEDILFADSNFFSFFSFPIIEGDPQSCLKDKLSIAISSSVAKKWFGDESPIGKMITHENWGREKATLKVTAVFQDVPENSHLQFTTVTPFARIEENPRSSGIMKSWPSDWVGTYLQLDEQADPTEVSERYFDMWRKYVDEEDTARIDFMPLENLYLDSHHLQNDYAELGNGQQVKTFIAIAIVILLIASINFVNLATAQAHKRSKEVGLRKTVGASRKQLIYQFITESALMTFIAFLLSAGLIALTIPWLNALAEIDLYKALVDPMWLLFSGLIIFVITTLATSVYPALVLTSFDPAITLRPGTHGNPGLSKMRKILVVGQFATSIVLIIASLIVYDQMQFIHKKDLGFTPDQVLNINLGSSNAIRENWTVIKSDIEGVPGVKLAANSMQTPGDNAFYWNYRFEGADEIEDPTGEGWRGFYIGENVVEVLDIEVIKGRTFQREMTMDSASFLLNESGWKYAIENYGDEWKEPIGKTIGYYTSNSGEWRLDKKGPVIGIVKDFHHHSLQRPIDPIVIHFMWGYRVLVKGEAASMPKVMKLAEEKWHNWGGRGPVNQEYLSDQFEDHYQTETQFSNFVLIFCVLAISIACLGLYGLSMFATQQRIKEIGVRKVLGASLWSLLGMLSKDFLKLIGIATVLAIPLAIYFMNGWLEDFAYRVNISVWHILAGIFIAMLIAQVTISYHSLRSAMANPTKALRTE